MEMAGKSGGLKNIRADSPVHLAIFEPLDSRIFSSGKIRRSSSRSVSPGQNPHHGAGSKFSRFLLAVPDSGQGGGGNFGLGNIVITGYRDIFCRFQAQRTQATHGANGQQVVETDNGGCSLWVVLEQGPNRIITGLARSLGSGLEGRIGLDAGLFQSRQISFAPVIAG